MSRKTLLTADELEQMPDDDSVQIELDEGELITMRPAGEEHGYYGVGIASLLNIFVKQHGLGRVYNADTEFRLRNDTVRAPDIAFVRREGAPDLAVEILFAFRFCPAAHA